MDKNLVNDTVQELFQKLNIIVNTTVEEKDETVVVKVETEDTGILIGYHGETLSALQLVASLIVYKKTNAWQRISLRVGDYVERREESLKAMAQRAIEKVIATNTPVVLPYLRSDERRIVHLLLEDNTDVASASEGEGESRRLVISPKTK